MPAKGHLPAQPLGGHDDLLEGAAGLKQGRDAAVHHVSETRAVRVVIKIDVVKNGHLGPPGFERLKPFVPLPVIIILVAPAYNRGGGWLIQRVVSGPFE
jgi:hypothetical protein